MPRKKSDIMKDEKVKKIVKQVKKDAKEIAGKIEEEVKEEVENLSLEKTKEKKEGKKPKLDKEKLKEKAKKLAEKIKTEKTEDIKEKLKKERETLIPAEDSVNSGIYIGTKVITPHMRKYVYRRRNDGIAILDINIIDKKLKEFIKELKNYNPEDFILVCKREAGWKAAIKFSELTGVRVFTKKYPAGILTNTKLPDFFEVEMVFICDPWIDKNAMRDAKKIKKKVFALCDTNNYTFDVDILVPCNNKSNKSLGLIFYILAREYLKAKGIKKEAKREDFVDE